MFPEKFCKSLSGKDTTSIRDKYIHKFITADTGVLSNARCLTEGVDIPDIDAVYFCDPKSSTVDIVQAIGRALRKPRNKITKETGYIILPLYYSSLDNIDDISENDGFSTIIDVLRAMSNHDERLKAELLSSWNSSGDHITKTDLANSTLSIENFDILIKNKITAEIINFIVDNWSKRFQEYKDWIDHNGCEPKYNKDNEVEYKLAWWATNQRTAYKNGKLTGDRISAIQSIGFRFENIMVDWDQRLQEWTG